MYKYIDILTYLLLTPINCQENYVCVKANDPII